MHARARAEIDDVIGSPHRFLVMLDDDERIPFFAQRAQGFEEANVVARMQADGRLVEDVKHAAQIGAELRREPDALRFAAAQSLGGTPEREITEPDVFHEAQPLLDLRDEIGRDHLVRSAEAQFADERERFAGGTRGEFVDRFALQPHVTRDRIEARAVAIGTRHRFAFHRPTRTAARR